MRTKFKAWAEPYINDHPEVILNEQQIQHLNDFVLEIGAGKGQFLIDMATKFPHLVFVGVEKNITCSGISAKKIVESKLENVFLIPYDVEKYFDLIPSKSVKAIFLNFSDPWPKKRHHKRRLTDDRFLEFYKRILKVDGMIYQKTDNVDLFNYSVEKFSESQDFEIVEKTDNYIDIDDFDCPSEYEQNFRNQNIPIHRLCVRYCGK